MTAIDLRQSFRQILLECPSVLCTRHDFRCYASNPAALTATAAGQAECNTRELS